MGRPNYNVVLTFCFRISDGLATGIWASSVLSNFISVTMGNDPEANTKVGIAQALQGSFLVATAIPAAWACGRYRRSSLLKCHSMCGFAAIGVLVSALTLFVHAGVDRLFQVLCLGLSLMGMAQASAPIVDSMFADSIPTGQRAGLYTGLTISYVLSSAVGPATAAVLFVLHGNVWSTERMSRVMLVGLALACIPASLLLMFDDTRVLGQEAEGLLKVVGKEESERQARTKDEEGGLREPLLQNGTDAEERGDGGDGRSDDLEGFESRLATPTDSRVHSRSITPSKTQAIPGIPATLVANTPLGTPPGPSPRTPTRSWHNKSFISYHHHQLQQQQQQQGGLMPPSPPQPPAPAPPPPTPPRKVQRVVSRRRRTEEGAHQHQEPQPELVACPSGLGSSLPSQPAAHSPSPVAGGLFQRSASARHASFGAADRMGREHGQRQPNGGGGQQQSRGGGLQRQSSSGGGQQQFSSGGGQRQSSGGGGQQQSSGGGGQWQSSGDGGLRQVVFGGASRQGSSISSGQASFTSMRRTSSGGQHLRHKQEQREHDGHQEGGSSQRDSKQLSSFAVPIHLHGSSDEYSTASGLSSGAHSLTGGGVFESKPYTDGAQLHQALIAEAEVKAGRAAEGGEAGTGVCTTEHGELSARRTAFKGQDNQGKTVAEEIGEREEVVGGPAIQDGEAKEGEPRAAAAKDTGAKDVATAAASTSNSQEGGAVVPPNTHRVVADSPAVKEEASSHAAPAATPAAPAAAAAATPAATLAEPAAPPPTPAATPAAPTGVRMSSPRTAEAPAPKDMPEPSREADMAAAATSSSSAATAAGAAPAGPEASGETQHQAGQLAGSVPAAATPVSSTVAAGVPAPAAMLVLSTVAAEVPGPAVAPAPAVSSSAVPTTQAPASAAAPASQMGPVPGPATQPPSAPHDPRQTPAIAAAAAAAAPPASTPTERLRAPAPATKKSAFDSSSATSTSSTSSSTSSSTLEAITQLAKPSAPAPPSSSFPGAVSQNTQATASTQPSSSTPAETAARAIKPAHPSSSLLEAVSQTAKSTAAAHSSPAAEQSLAAGAAAPVPQLSARAASAAHIPTLAAPAPSGAASFTPSSASPAAARAAAAASALGAWPCGRKTSGETGGRTLVVISRRPSGTLPEPHGKTVPGMAGTSEGEQQQQQQQQQQQKGAAVVEGHPKPPKSTGNTHEIGASPHSSTGADAKGGSGQPAHEQAGGTPASHHAMTMPAGTVEDASQGGGGSGPPGLPQNALPPVRAPVLGCITPVAIPYILAVTDCCMGLASGMTIKFFPIFFRTEAGLSPSSVSLMYTAIPLALSFVALFAQRESRLIGRVQTIVTNRLIGISLLLFIATHTGLWTVPAAIVPLYVCRTSIMNAQYPIQRSILMDYVPKATRARWASVESVTQFGWSGSAALGGFLIERYGFQTTFFVTASMQLIGWLCSLLLLPLVPRKEVSVVAAQQH